MNELLLVSSIAAAAIAGYFIGRSDGRTEAKVNNLNRREHRVVLRMNRLNQKYQAAVNELNRLKYRKGGAR